MTVDIASALWAMSAVIETLDYNPRRRGMTIIRHGGHAMADIIARCEAKGLRMTEQRRIVARVIGAAEDHPDVEELYARAAQIDPRISIATVYRTVKLFEEAGILDRLEFGDGRARYEDAERDHHDHLIDVNTGAVIEFIDPDIEALQERIRQLVVNRTDKQVYLRIDGRLNVQHQMDVFDQLKAGGVRDVGIVTGRDVVVAVSKAGGLGVLGAVGFSPEQLEIELNWIDEHIGDHPYGVDIVIPNKYEGMDADMSTEDLTKMLQDMVPKEHLEFAHNLMLVLCSGERVQTFMPIEVDERKLGGMGAEPPYQRVNIWSKSNTMDG